MEGYLRRAEQGDVRMLFEWANDAAVRQNSFSSGPIAWEEHQDWFMNMLQNKDVGQYIYMYGDIPAGQARVTVNGAYAQIGYSICRMMRGKGHGRALLALLAEQVKRDFPTVLVLEGKVKPENISSQKAFLSAGYQDKCRIYELHIKDF